MLWQEGLLPAARFRSNTRVRWQSESGGSFVDDDDEGMVDESLI